MAAKTEINWTDASKNPWIGCTKISEACDNCYAWQAADVMRRAESWSGRVGLRVWGGNSERYFPGDDDGPKAWYRDVQRWNEQAKLSGARVKVFSADMADLFEDYHGPCEVRVNERRARTWRLIEETPYIDWQVLTKRPENILRMVPWGSRWPRNLWIGTTVENQARADERIPHLIEVPAVVRFLSVEPIRGPVSLAAWPGLIDWVICGCESISKKRPFDVSWVRALRDECVASRTAFWWKQWGVWDPGVRSGGGIIRQQVPTLNGKTAWKKFAVLDGVTWTQFPAFRWIREGKAKTAWDRLDPYDLDDSDEKSTEGAAE